MTESIHEGLGVAALWAVAGAVVLGMAAFWYQWTKRFVPWARPSLVRWHRFLSAGFLALLAGHYLTTDKAHLLLLAGATGFVAVFALGASLRLGRRFFRPTVRAKILLVVAASVSLAVGHTLVEGRGARESGASTSHAGDATAG